MFSCRWALPLNAITLLARKQTGFTIKLPATSCREHLPPGEARWFSDLTEVAYPRNLQALPYCQQLFQRGCCIIVTTNEWALLRKIESGEVKQIGNLRYIGSMFETWRFQVTDFDDTLQGGRDINQDLRDLFRNCGQNCLVMELTFPRWDRYPAEPFFLRIVSPRCKQYTGHVTAGGSMCIESLTNTGSPNGWSPDYCVESMLHKVFHSMITCERKQITPESRPGGVSGPLRIDVHGEQGIPVLQAYSMAEARESFDQDVTHHMTNGW